MAEILRLEHLEKSFGTHAVLRGVDLRVEKGEVLSVIGSSGSGKSTMLRCINLLETPTGGQTALNMAVPETAPGVSTRVSGAVRAARTVLPASPSA